MAGSGCAGVLLPPVAAPRATCSRQPTSSRSVVPFSIPCRPSCNRASLQTTPSVPGGEGASACTPARRSRHPNPRQPAPLATSTAPSHPPSLPCACICPLPTSAASPNWWAPSTPCSRRERRQRWRPRRRWPMLGRARPPQTWRFGWRCHRQAAPGLSLRGNSPTARRRASLREARLCCRARRHAAASPRTPTQACIARSAPPNNERRRHTKPRFLSPSFISRSYDGAAHARPPALAQRPPSPPAHAASPCRPSLPPCERTAPSNAPHNPSLLPFHMPMPLVRHTASSP